MPSSYSEHVVVPYSFAGMRLKAERRRDGLMNKATSTKGVLCIFPAVVDDLWMKREKDLWYEGS
jgi:hypothetical protein